MRLVPKSRFWSKSISFVKYYKHSILVLLVIVIYCEYMVYKLQKRHWHQLNRHCEGNCTKVLFVADPQIEGYYTAVFPINYLFMWDADQYLSNTFSEVMEHFDPHMIVFLGDIMDEGSVATLDEYYAYKDRIFKIFRVPPKIQELFLPGDNDIGGEDEPINKTKIQLFEKAFFTRDVFHHQNITFFTVNQMVNIIPDAGRLTDEEMGLKIVISHHPITMFSKIEQKLHPHLYFTAHTHSSSYYRGRYPFRPRDRYALEGHEDLEVDPSAETSVVAVPTCSYRMGTKKIGYGAAVFSKNNTRMHYTVFWTPERFPLLIC